MKRLIAISGVAIILLVAALTFLRSDKNTRTFDPQTNALSPGPRRPQRSDLQAERSVATATPEIRKLILPSSELEDLTPRALQLMRDSLQTFQTLELEKRNFRSRSTGEVLLSGLQRKLFLDDYTYARILSGVDCSRASSVYTNLLEQIANFDNEALQQGVRGL